MKKHLVSLKVLNMRIQKSLASSEQQLAKEWHKPIVRKFKKRKAHSTFINIIWGADFADMILIRKFNKRIVFFLL